uniref:F-box domain-containing protein n=1 Tax=Moniliophthora roreri TaxID=221103 RepID=A0A0W0F1C6_MONRR
MNEATAHPPTLSRARSWLPRARCHLFRCLTNPHDRYLDILWDLIKHPLSTFSTEVVKTIRLQRHRSEINAFLLWCGALKPVSANGDIVFKAVQNLIVEVRDFAEDLTPEGRQVLYTDFPMTTKLCLARTNFQTHDQVACLLSSFPSLEVLFLHDIHIVQSYSSTPSLHALPTSVRVIEIESWEDEELEDRQLLPILVPLSNNIQTFRFRTSCQCPVVVILFAAVVLGAVAVNLECLEIETNYPARSTPELKELFSHLYSFTNCRSLHHVKLHIEALEAPWLQPLLSSLPQASLKSLEVPFLLQYTIDATVLDEILVSFPYLECLKYNVPVLFNRDEKQMIGKGTDPLSDGTYGEAAREGTSLWAKMNSEIECSFTRFPKCWERGILKPVVKFRSI